MSVISLEKLVQDYASSNDPLPGDAVHVIGDGDFRAIGAEFLRHLVEMGGLRPEDHVLDIGCGFGRIALPLARYLGPRARYLGFDIVREPIDWCRQHVAPLHPGFAFAHLDVLHPLYNPAGLGPGTQGFLDGLPDTGMVEPSFAFAVSVFTHLQEGSIERYLADLGTILRRGGTLFMTAFLVGVGAPATGEGCAFPVHRWRREGSLTALIGEPLTAAVGVDAGWLLQRCVANGLVPRRVVHGRWRGGEGCEGPFQDMLVLSRA